jgi:hypothetical protein
MALGARIETAHRHVFDQALAQRADRLGIDSCCDLSSRHHARSARGFDFLAAQQEA